MSRFKLRLAQHIILALASGILLITGAVALPPIKKLIIGTSNKEFPPPDNVEIKYAITPERKITTYIK